MTEQLYYCNHGSKTSATYLYKIKGKKLFQISKHDLAYGGKWREMPAKLTFHKDFVSVDCPASDDGVGPIGFQIVKY